jgi:MazG family protein
MSREPQSYSLDDLLFLMARLRDPNGGCPWDLKQTYATIAPSTIEEAYEVVDAIERKDYAHLKEELGDLLFQAIFYSQLAKEENLFNFADVIDILVSKLIRRHPHVFPDGRLHSDAASAALSEDAVKQNWEAIKSEERKEKGKTGLLADVPTGLPALTRALKLQKRAAQVGFDWPSVAGVCEKMREELAELESAIAEGERAEQEAELGDILFTCVNLARHLKIDPEAALRNANNKFSRRFSHMENAAQQLQVELQNLNPAELDEWWESAKKAGD